jgi:hypothetical protein
MAGRTHQGILALVIRQMRLLGFELIAIDGHPTLGATFLPIPEKFGRHRPDAVGRSVNAEVCLGEAKTADDITSRRTREQLEDYLRSEGQTYSFIVFGYPATASGDVEHVLHELGASDCPQVVRLAVPDELLRA